MIFRKPSCASVVVFFCVLVVDLDDVKSIRMADIGNIERIKLEKLLVINGYVLDFSNRTFADFFYEHAGVDIYSEKYSDKGESKANRLRTFWKKEENYLVAKVLSALLEYFKEIYVQTTQGWTDDLYELYGFASSIAKRLQGELGDHIAAIKIVSDDRDFETVGKSVRQLIHENKPEEAIDRLHTYFAMFIRNLCLKHGVSFDNSKAIHSLLGEYIKCINGKGMLESVMGERILKYSINLIDAFNDVRNNQSLAHPNKLLGYDESLLIFRTVSSLIAFINSIEVKIDAQNPKPLSIDDLPF
jgi:Abortive infection C-terminus